LVIEIFFEKYFYFIWSILPSSAVNTGALFTRPVFTDRAEKKHCTTMLFHHTGRVHGCVHTSRVHGPWTRVKKRTRVHRPCTRAVNTPVNTARVNRP